MKTLDRYITRTFLLNFVILFVVLMSLFVVVDLIVDIDEFVDAGDHWARQRLVEREVQGLDVDAKGITFAIYDNDTTDDLIRQFNLPPEVAKGLIGRTTPSWWHSMFGTVVKIVDYYVPLIVLLYVFFSGLLVVAAMGFTLTGMLRARELTAIVASGISMYRVATPLLVVGIGLNALTLPAQEFIIPSVAPKLARSKSQVAHEAIKNFPVHYAADENGHLFSAAEFDPTAQRLRDLTILERDPNGLTERLITASGATWDDASAGWRLESGRAQSPPGPEAIRGEAQRIGFFETTLSPNVLLARRATIYPRLLPLHELQQMQAVPAVTPHQRAQITQIVWSRFSLLVVNVLILVMGLTFFLLRAPENMLIQSIKAAAVCMGAWGGSLIMLQVSSDLFNPVAAAWLPVVIYLPVSAFLLQTVKT